jgi:hypothetical protein
VSVGLVEGVRVWIKGPAAVRDEFQIADLRSQGLAHAREAGDKRMTGS